MMFSGFTVPTLPAPRTSAIQLKVAPENRARGDHSFANSRNSSSCCFRIRRALASRRRVLPFFRSFPIIARHAKRLPAIKPFGDAPSPGCTRIFRRRFAVTARVMFGMPGMLRVDKDETMRAELNPARNPPHLAAQNLEKKP